MPDTSIVVTMQDRYSDAVKKMATVTKSFSKDVDALEETLHSLNKNKITLKMDLGKAKSELKAAERQFEQTHSAADGLKMELAQANYDNIVRNLKAVTRAAGDTEKAISKTENRAGSGGKSAAGSIVTAIAASGIGQMAGEIALNAGNALAGSMFGLEGGTLASSMLSFGASGAAMGTAILGPGVGTAIGAAAGAALGGVNGILQNFEQKDEAFKEYYKGLYETVSAGTDADLAAGITVSGGRERTKMAFAQRFGSDEAAEAYLDQVKEMAKNTNYSYDSITGYSKLLLNTYGADETFGVLQKLSDATAGLNLSDSDVNMFISGLSRMRTTGKASREFLNYFSERGVDADQAIADAMGVRKSNVSDLVTSGGVSGEAAAQAILDYIQQNYGGLSEKLAGTYDAMVNNLGDVMTDVNAAYGDAYTEARKSGVQADQDAYGGILGEALGRLNGIIGETRAFSDNLADQFQREAMSAMLLGESTTVFQPEDAEKLDALRAQFREASAAYDAGSREAGLTMERLKEEAEGLATAAYESSAWYQKVQDAELEQIDALRENTAGLAAATTAYEKGNAFTKGIAATTGDVEVEGVTAYTSLAEDQSAWLAQSGRSRRGYAYGLDYVPYDNFPALLHQGERVQTAVEARSRGKTPSITIGGTYHIREEADIPKVASELLAQLELAGMRG